MSAIQESCVLSTTWPHPMKATTFDCMSSFHSIPQSCLLSTTWPHPMKATTFDCIKSFHSIPESWVMGSINDMTLPYGSHHLFTHAETPLVKSGDESKERLMDTWFIDREIDGPTETCIHGHMIHRHILWCTIIDISVDGASSTHARWMSIKDMSLSSPSYMPMKDISGSRICESSVYIFHRPTVDWFTQDSCMRETCIHRHEMS